jgi:hypothetical protein
MATMTQFERNVAETQAALGISARAALALEFAAMGAWASIAKNNKAAAVAQIGLSHTLGDLSADDMRQCFATLA